MQSDDPAIHNINDNPATHDIGDDDPVARAGFVSDDTTVGTAAPCRATTPARSAVCSTSISA
jgi:hypothetical protein